MISTRNILDLRLRRDIYQFISENPGLNISEISLRMKMSRSTLRHHLRYLMKFNLINNKVDRKNKRFHACGKVGIKDQELLCLLRQKVPFRIIMHLIFTGFCSKIELAKELEVYPSIIDFHFKKLLDMDIVEPVEVKDGKFVSSYRNKTIFFVKPIGREKFYGWKISKKPEIIRDIYRLLINHKESMIDSSIIDALNGGIEDWNRVCDGKRPKNHFSFNSTVDNFINILEELFHFPFHF